MPYTPRTWQEELEIIDRTMKAISGITDPEELVNAYWDGMGDLLTIDDFVAVSRRHTSPPFYHITRSSRFTEHHNPWTHRHRLPLLSGGLLGEICYANKPVIIEDLPSRLQADDPAHFYLQGFQSLVALPQYDNGEGLNCTIALLPAGMEIQWSRLPMLHWQSGLFGRGTQNLVLRNELTKALNALDRELQTVGDIQRSLLPEILPDIPGFELSSLYETSARAGGDYYDFFRLENGSWGIFIADVSGHSTPAAVLMAITHAIAHSQPGSHTPPNELLNYLNRSLVRFYTRGGTFVTAFYAVLDPETRQLTYSTAGHNPPRLVRGDSVISLDEHGALPLGIDDEQSYATATVQLEAGDVLALYTDGITEAMAPAKDGARELFGVRRLDDTLGQCIDHGMDSAVQHVRQAVDTFTHGSPATDDRTLIVMRCK